MTPSQPSLTPSPAPGGDPDVYFALMLGELRDLHECGMLEDEDYAYQRAEQLSAILNEPRRRWLAWLYLAAPLALGMATVVWYQQQNIELTTVFSVIAAFCTFAAIARRSRESAVCLDNEARLTVIRALLSADLITSNEFSAFEERLLSGAKGKFAV